MAKGEKTKDAGTKKSLDSNIDPALGPTLELTEEQKKEAYEKEYGEKYAKYQELKGAFPSKDWDLERLTEEVKKLENKGTSNSVINPTIENVESVKEPINVPAGYVSLRNKHTGEILVVNRITYGFLKNNKELELHIETPKEVKEL